MTEAEQAAYERGRADERAAVVAWLREQIRGVDSDNAYWGGPHKRKHLNAPEIRDAIERREHMKGTDNG